MIEITAVEEQDRLLPLCERCGVLPQEASGAYVMAQKDELLGACFYRLGESEDRKILSVSCLYQPVPDPLMLDGLIRAVFSFAMGRGAYQAAFAKQADGESFVKLYPQMDCQKSTVDIEKFFTICTNCK